MSSSARSRSAGTLLMLLLAIGASSPVGHAQETVPDTGPPEEAEKASQEVDVSEETYRRYMELKDPSLGRQSLPPLPTTPTAGLEKMDALPEGSRRHLRDELREIILGGDPWTPDSAMTRYPFTPSEAARKDGELRQKEAEAWGELVGKYHEREAQQYAERQRAGAPAGSARAGDGSAGSAQGSQGGSQGQGGGSPSGTSASEAARQARRAAEQSSPRSQPVNRPQPPQGATESALDYLTGGAGGGSPVGQADPSQAGSPDGAPDGLPPSARQSTGRSSPESSTASSAEASTQPSSEGATKNVAAASVSPPGMTAETAPSANPEPQRRAPTPRPPADGDTESALDYLTGGAESADAGDAAGTADRGAPAAAGLLTLEELETVRGIGGDPEQEASEAAGKGEGE